MHPALSVILFTTASGAGYGLLFLIGLLTGTSFLPESRWFAVAAFGLSLGAISFGLLASTFHLGRPERAWRAFSQWRTSWLSREGVASVIAYVPAGLLALDWIFRGQAVRLARLADGADVGGHGLLHRHDLCLPEADPALAPSLGAGELSPARADDRGAAAAGAARPLRQAAGAGLLVYRCRARRRSCGQARLLAGHRPRRRRPARRKAPRAWARWAACACWRRPIPRTITS